MVEVKLPQLAETMEEGTIVKYLVKLGDEVKKGDCIYELETDKAAMEIESPAAGFVKAFIAEEGQTLAVGDAVLILGQRDEKVSEKMIDFLKAKITSRNNHNNDKIEYDTQINTADVLESTGPLVSEADIKLGAVMPLSGFQKITGRRMLQSKHEMPCFYMRVNVDVTDLVEFREKLNRSGDIKVSYNDFIMRAVVSGLEKFPIMTGQLDGEVVKLAESINVGLAVSVPNGLVVVVVADADKKNVTEIAHESTGLIEKANKNKLQPADLEGACITVSNLGVYGVESFIPIVVPGQCSILGIGQITDSCVCDNGDTVIRKLMSMTLSVDHKVTNGAYAAEFLDLIRKTLEDISNFK